MCTFYTTSTNLLFSKIFPWSFNLKVISGPNPSKYQWQQAIESLVQSDELIWQDKDKKGRPRKRNCRNELRSLHMNHAGNKTPELTNNQGIRLELNALIDPLGRSIKPLQIKHWLEIFLEQSLSISHVQRDEIKLLEC